MLFIDLDKLPFETHNIKENVTIDRSMIDYTPPKNPVYLIRDNPNLNIKDKIEQITDYYTKSGFYSSVARLLALIVFKHDKEYKIIYQREALRAKKQIRKLKKKK